MGKIEKPKKTLHKKSQCHHQSELILEPPTPASEFGRTRKSRSSLTIKVSTPPPHMLHSLRKSVSSEMLPKIRPPEIPPTLSSMPRDLLAASSQTEQSRKISLFGHSRSSLEPVRSP